MSQFKSESDSPSKTTISTLTNLQQTIGSSLQANLDDLLGHKNPIITSKTKQTPPKSATEIINKFNTDLEPLGKYKETIKKTFNSVLNDKSSLDNKRIIIEDPSDLYLCFIAWKNIVPGTKLESYFTTYKDILASEILILCTEELIKVKESSDLLEIDNRWYLMLKGASMQARSMQDANHAALVSQLKSIISSYDCTLEEHAQATKTLFTNMTAFQKTTERSMDQAIVAAKKVESLIPKLESSIKTSDPMVIIPPNPHPIIEYKTTFKISNTPVEVKNINGKTSISSSRSGLINILIERYPTLYHSLLLLPTSYYPKIRNMDVLQLYKENQSEWDIASFKVLLS